MREPLTSAKPGASILVLVSGEAGTGKTRFIEWLVTLPELCRVPRLNVAFTGSGAVVRQEPAPPAGTAPAAGGVRFERPPGRPQAGALAPPRSNPLGAPALRELADSLDTGAPTLLVVEDVHLADEQDAYPLRKLLARPLAGLRAVLTYRPEELATPGLVLGAPVGYPAGLGIVQLRLGPLGEAEVRQMATKALGEDRCSARFVARLHNRSGGIAQVVADLLAELKKAGPLPGPEATPAGLDRLTARDVDEAPVPVRRAELVLGRMAALGEEPRRVVRAAAVLNEAASEDELISVAALPTGSGRVALTAALSHAVLHEVSVGQYGFRLPMEATAVYQLMPGPVRGEMHRRAAEALTVRHPEPWARLARHQLASGQIEDWLRSVENAALRAVEARNHQLAITLLEDTLAHAQVRQSNRSRLALLLARNAYNGLRSDQTVEVLRRLVDDEALPVAARGEIRLELGLLLGNQIGRDSEGRAELIKAVEELSTRPALAARAMAALALPYWPAGSLADNLAWLARAEATAAGSGDEVIQAAVTANRLTVLLSMGDPDGWQLLEELPRDDEDPLILHHSARGVSNAGDAAIWLGEYAQARELLAEAPKLGTLVGDLYLQQMASAKSLIQDLMSGHWAGLAVRARAVLAEAGEMPLIAGHAGLVLGLLAVAKGDWSQVAGWLSGSALTGDEGAVPLVAAAAGGRIRLALARQDLGAAAREAAEAWGRLQAKSVWVWAAELAPWAVEATIRAEELGTARAMVDEFAAGIADRQAPAADAALMWCRALLAEADGELTGAAEYFWRTCTRYQTLPRPYEAALAAEASGRCALASSPETAAGISELSAAANELEALGATWDVARVRAQLRAHPGSERRRRGRRGYGDRLSPREQEVAQLVGAGLSNREIAITLFLSPRTVEQHVARACKKLGVLSRHDLATVSHNGDTSG
ncbi:DNA-binding CsgD family transcriptional regulator [Streptomyces griseochromogenes]|uniref:DNA-binding CsgD family transcriptional regulator n=1 Tax=Streptomyces griseochromogenes TaxID=68214 RepID=A0ABS4MB60_9ACTN|nr:LuxR C-terminal-related transcriptional regulator [Streptomyces griseochromogenes]MBP2056596.1 DNA-binding CsgD family transcriptional regulator [Streptomyces griseochromogenes]